MLGWVALLCHAWGAPGSRGEESGVYFGEPEQLAGCRARMDVDSGADGTVEWLYWYSFDAEGLLVDVLGEVLSGGTGHPRMAYRYDDEGRLTRRGWDGDDDGRLESLTVNHWFGDELLGSDDFAGGSITHTDYLWDTGRLVEIDRDEGSDGMIESVITQRWSGDVLVQADTDTDNDGEVDLTVWYHYDAFGRMTDRETDVGADGFLDTLQREVWGPGGRLVERIRDANLDGLADVRSVIYWSCAP